MGAKIPMLDLGPEVEELWDELRTALDATLRSTRFILGPNVVEFEREAAEWLGVRRAVSLNSGTDALVLGLRALGIGPGDEVVTSAFTFVATAEAICRVGATPVFVDVEPASFNLDLERLAAHLDGPAGERTRLVIPVHLFGHPVDMDAVLSLCEPRGIPVFEDAAQAFGATWRGRRVGGFGRAGAFSFFPSKNLGAYGDGGLVVSDDDSFADTVLELRNHGALDKYEAHSVGYNSRLDEIQAAVLRVKLPHVDAWNDKRREVARLYREGLAGLDGVETPDEAEGAHHVFHQYTLRVRDGRRDELERRLGDAGIACAVYYRVPLHRLAPFAQPPGTELRETDRASEQVLSLPIGAYQPEPVTARIVAALRGDQTGG
ncbi:MAG: DegT/DnrJ/EryC1/StrS family aminotransferase [Deltaproteobacteria bacterium]|nr:DegT/DnrJ/EryC1/StrS family aminotransferase [Deltaproteobacteria bacterium]